MVGTVELTLADGSTEELKMFACGTTAIRYKQLFKREILAGITSVVNMLNGDQIKAVMAASDDEELDMDQVDGDTMKALLDVLGSDGFSVVSEMAFVMNQQEEGAKMSMLSYDDYVDWLERFDTMTFLQNAMTIIGIYMGNRAGSVDAKKKNDQQTEK